MPNEVKTGRYELAGIAASPGFAIGTLWLQEAQTSHGYVPTGHPGLEAIALKNAIHVAGNQIEHLLAGSSGQAASILEFQRAVLADDTFYHIALIALNDGVNALQAWSSVLEAESAEYKAGSDETFSARALDFDDIQTRVAHILCNYSSTPIPAGVIVLADNLSPTAFMTHDWHNGGIALTESSTASHVAILARQFSVPMLVNLEQSQRLVKNGEKALLDSRGEIGRLIIAPTPNDENLLLPTALPVTELAGPVFSLMTGEGKPISLMVNLAHLRELDHLNSNHFDGIGLVRTEFLFAEQNQAGEHADEEVQFQAYCRILKWAKNKPVFIRTLDAGGDKAVPGFAGKSEFSKLRGIRLSLSTPDLFRIQIRALLRAAALGSLHVTLPMVSTEADLNEALALFENEAEKLAFANIAYAMPSIGIMVEVPAVAMTLERFAHAAHFAIGTNDLIQYACAEPREATGVKSSVDHPAIIALIKNIVAIGKALNKQVSVCGDAASDAKAIEHLLNAGVTNFSISPPRRTSIVTAIQAYHGNKEA